MDMLREYGRIDHSGIFFAMIFLNFGTNIISTPHPINYYLLNVHISYKG